MSEQHNSFGITGRVAVVTGGNRNIGRSIVLTLAKEGVTTIVLYRDGADEAHPSPTLFDASQPSLRVVIGR